MRSSGFGDSVGETKGHYEIEDVFLINKSFPFGGTTWVVSVRLPGLLRSKPIGEYIRGNQ